MPSVYHQQYQANNGSSRMMIIRISEKMILVVLIVLTFLCTISPIHAQMNERDERRKTNSNNQQDIEETTIDTMDKNIPFLNLPGFDHFNMSDNETASYYQIIDLNFTDDVPKDDRGRTNYFMGISKIKFDNYYEKNLSTWLTPLTLSNTVVNKEQNQSYHTLSIHDENRPKPVAYEQISPTEIESPVLMFLADGIARMHRYQYGLWEHNGFQGIMSLKMINFCSTHYIPKRGCRILFEQLFNLQRVLQYDKLYEVATDLNNHKEEMQRQVPNKHLKRSLSAVDAELENLHHDIDKKRVSNMYAREALVYDYLIDRMAGYLQELKQGLEKLVLEEEAQRQEQGNQRSKMTIGNAIGATSSSSRPLKRMTRRQRLQRLRKLATNRFAVIHSCLLPNQTQPKDTRILVSLLEEVERYQLQKELFVTLVLHYGEDLPDFLSDRFPQVIFVHISDDISFFEVPSIRILHRISQYIVKQYDEMGIITMLHQLTLPSSTSGEGQQSSSPSSPLNLYPQVLYMHTKGISYSTIYPQIEDWRNYMTYFVVEKHQTAYHLLRSGEFDAYGINFGPEPRMFSGNFWWSTTSYIVTLPPLLYEKALKYSAELWLFESKGINVYHPFISNKNHAFDRFPRFCYAEIQDFYKKNGDRFLQDLEQYQYMIDVAYIPGYDLWKYFCVMLYEVQYRNIHKMEPLILPQEREEKTLFNSFACLGGRKSSRLKREKPLE